jgi:hypothetical protein
MQNRSVLITLLLAAGMTGASVTRAADNSDTSRNSAPSSASQRAAPEHGRHDGMQGGAMMGGMGAMMSGNAGNMSGMAGMMDMMNGCSQMMSGATTPHLPAGNEKLQLKMQAEIMQKTAEILARYAGQIGADGKSTP